MINKAILVGRLTADPELKQTPNGISVTTFSIAIDRRSAKEKTTDFINIVAWRQTAEFIAKYFKKGNAIGIDGSIQTRNYTDKEGNKRYAFEVVVDNASFVESKASSAGASSNVAPNFANSTPNTAFSSGSVGDFQELEDDDEDLPF